MTYKYVYKQGNILFEGFLSHGPRLGPRIYFLPLIHLSTYPRTHLHTYPLTHPFSYLPTHSSTYPPTHPLIHPSIYPSLNPLPIPPSLIDTPTYLSPD